MFNASRPRLVRGLVACLFAALAVPAVRAQAVSGNPTLDRQLARLDLGIGAIGSITKDVAGTNYLGFRLTQQTSNTVGALVQIRYTKSPWMGLEFNYGYARYTQNFNNYITAGGVQSNATEYTLGYIAHPAHQFAGLQPFFGGGLGTTAFRPTSGGGQGLRVQARMTYYYTAGVEKIIFGDHLGIRGQFRQTFYKAPDFGENYLTIQQRTNTIEPGVGFFLRF